MAFETSSSSTKITWGSGAELVSLLARVEDLGAAEVLLTPTNASPDEVSRVADLIG